ncbi:PREDICTED: serine/threonine-protein kinase 16-like [Branchiostoma belcheri]|uniref:non-specific serine/threonine protein kinase n=1 Tax=Branchiostoma belcheri TaxID=7741 RepID=A0A6P4ZYW0_BRABE|nr:PREDICTED: serine/threonine-protein kinase 16-like [Branchiostoma belcheri]KAI8516068.1 Serine/threonine-protein kinase 16 [Branchiostoma belcheri]
MGCYCSKGLVTINNRAFYMQERIGEGGYAYIDLIEDKKSGKFFALKRITCHSKEDETEALREAEYCRMFDHPNIIKVEEFTTVKKTQSTSVWIVFPFYKLGSLQDLIEKMAKNNGHIHEDRLLGIFKGICEGVKAMHEATPAPVTHRDIKPANVLLDENDTPVLMDFGSMGPARVEIKGSGEAQAMQDLAAAKCTMPWRAPELFHVESHCIIDDKVDIWSLGCTLYAMVYLEGPFDAVWQKGDSVQLAVLSRNVKFPEDQQSLYSAELLDLINALLVVNPAERPNINWVIQRVEDLCINALAANRV